MSSRPTKFNVDCEHCSMRHKSMFGVLCDHEAQEISTNKSCISYAKGQLLFHEDSRPTGVYCINSGKVKVYKLGYNGKEQIVHLASSGGLLGYRAMISETRHTMSAEALENSQVCFIPKEDFLNMVKDSHALHENLLKAACKELGIMSDSLANLAQRNVRERTAAALVMLKDTYGQEGFDDGPVDINLTREDLANIVGTATETLIRQLHDFKEEELIETKGRKIRVTNTEGLIRIFQ